MKKNVHFGAVVVYEFNKEEPVIDEVNKKEPVIDEVKGQEPPLPVRITIIMF